ISGRPNLPVTTLVPTSDSGVKGRPTLLSNAETYAQVAAAVFSGLGPVPVPGPADDPGTRLLTLTRRDGKQEVLEVIHGTPWLDILDAEELARPILVGGYHGAWVGPNALTTRTVSQSSMHELGARLGAGIVIPLPDGLCPLTYTTQLLGYLAGQSALQCGPCRFGLPELTQAFKAGANGTSWSEALHVAQLVEKRGACAHPDGTARLARSAIAMFSSEAALHHQGHCTYMSMKAVRAR
ncbi:MAG TPA: NADH-ubiquinone oxidoreductase-F iron-sulfur binding region domain-containing protein, partial [Marmoricola sp.]|nr:NADH-ubiquinone oxidoreductase-F iron-sulfur binding region domain-containing protein [Marmoricola sp.]